MEQPTTNRMRDAFLSVCQSFHMAPLKLVCSHQPDERSQPANPPRRVQTGPCCAQLCFPGARVKHPGRMRVPLQHPQHVQEGCQGLLLLSHRWGGQMEELGVPIASFPNYGEVSGVCASPQWGYHPSPPGLFSTPMADPRASTENHEP